MRTAHKAFIIGATEPILIVRLAWLLFAKRPSYRLSLCILVATAGLVLIASDSNNSAQKSLAGDALIALSTLFAASYVVFSARLAAHFPAAVLASAQQMIGLLGAAALISGWAKSRRYPCCLAWR